ncbi:MAG: hypothetical protein M1826_002400 [Phylliscum demangeonii]|nr:MAG: hypothetical protein M1826_002400 [Phylliscum demangeonii]
MVSCTCTRKHDTDTAAVHAETQLHRPPPPTAASPAASPPPAPPPPPPPSRIPSTRHENIYTLPNLLTCSRLLAAPVIGYLVLHDGYGWAMGLVVYAGVTDWVDGYVARRWRQQTVVGTVIDPMADKALMTVLTVTLAVKGLLPIWVAAIILGRDMGLGIAAVYYRWISLPGPKTFRRYWDFSIPSAEVHPTRISKVNTGLQLALLGACTAQPLLAPWLAPPNLSPSAVELLAWAMWAMQNIVATTTIWSGLSYLDNKEAVKIVNQHRARKMGLGQDGSGDGEVGGNSGGSELELGQEQELELGQEPESDEGSKLEQAQELEQEQEFEPKPEPEPELEPEEKRTRATMK